MTATMPEGDQLFRPLFAKSPLPTLIFDVTRAGYVVITAMGGREGIALAQEHLPQLVIVDLLMPEISGFDVVKPLRADLRTRGLPMLVLTGKDLTESERAFLTPRVEQVILKGAGAAQTVVDAIRRVFKAEKGAA